MKTDPKAQFANIIDKIHEGFVALDAGMHYTYINQRGSELLQRKPEELIGKNYWEEYPQDKETSFGKAYLRALETQTPVELEDYYAPRGRWFENRIYPSENGLSIFFNDITERKEVEEKLRVNEDRLRLAVAAGGIGIWDIDLRSGVRTWSDEGKAIYGLAAHEYMDYERQLALIHPDDRARVDELVTAFRDQGSLKQLNLEHRILRPDGSLCWVEVHGEAIYGSEPLPDRLIGTVIDITERKQMEEKVSAELADTKQLQHISSQLIQEDNINLLYEQILDAAIALTHADMGSLQMLYPEKNELLLLAWKGFDPVSAASWEWVSVDSTTTCSMALRRGERVIVADVETSDFLAGAEVLDFYHLSGVKAVQSTPLVSRNGHIVGMITTHWRELHQVPERDLNLLDVLARQAADLIERKRAEEAILRLNEVLETRVMERTVALVESEREVRRMASMLTMAEQEERRRISQLLHDELQQQLYAIQINLNFAQGDAETGNTLTALERMAEAGQWLSESIEVTRQLTVDLSPPILKSEGLADALNWLISQMKQTHGLKVLLTADHAFRMPDEDMRVLLFQSIRELLFNTVKHAGIDQAAVELRSQNGQLVIRVTDEGCGFNVAETATRAEREGRLGLFGVRERLRLFGGRMEIDSAPGSGTRILIHIPTDLEAES